MRHAWVSLALVTVLATVFATGFGGLISGAERWWWLLALHGAAALALVTLLPAKGQVIVDSVVRRPGVDVARIAFALLLVLIVVTLATGLTWVFAGPVTVGRFSLLTVHVLAGYAAGPLVVWHVARMRYGFHTPGAVGRRAFLRTGATAVAGLLLWPAAEATLAAARLPGAHRRFTGSYETGSGTGAFPVVSWLFDFPAPTPPETWQLVVEGDVEQPLRLAYADVLRLAGATLSPILDCTGGWYSVQEWRGVSVGHLLDLVKPTNTARSVTFIAVSGYDRRFALDDARAYLLATHVAGAPLDHGHGFPLRLVAPDHRGFAWVKWVSRVVVSESSEYLQPPVPLR